ncbi:hypothetical protein [Actinoplanes derwentensis]|nr:hypothetical protein Ade03nite_90110 [Actinoplanes derwentensis]
MQKRALDNERIKVEWNTVVEEILGADGKIVGVRLATPSRASVRVIEVS